MSDKVVAITGTTSGTGYVCAREMAKLGAKVLLLNRPSARATDSLTRLQSEVPSGLFQAIDCDLQCFDSVRQAAQQICDEHDVLDVLCNNAGVMALPDCATVDGYDVQMQTNSISPFLLTSALVGLLKQRPEVRVVNHTSMARLGAPHEAKFFAKHGGALSGDGTDAENASFGGPRWSRYHQSKLANGTFTNGLKSALEARGVSNVKVMIAHPGLASTGLQVTTAQSGGMQLGGDFMTQAQSAEDGALSIIRACAYPDARSGDFCGLEGWTGFPKKLTSEESLFSTDNIKTNWDGCEAAVGEFRL